MAGPAQRGSRGRGRSSRTASSPRLQAAGPTVAPGSVGTTPALSPSKATPDPSVQLVTRSTYRVLVTRGLSPDEAANLTAFMCGIPVADVHWSLRQVNQLLFLRELAQLGRFGSADGGRSRAH